MQVPCAQHLVTTEVYCPVREQRKRLQTCTTCRAYKPATQKGARVVRHCPSMMAPSRAQTSVQESQAATAPEATNRTLLCTSVTAATVQQALQDIESIAEAGADIIELRLDMLTDFKVEQHLEKLLRTTGVPKLVTMRPVWEG